MYWIWGCVGASEWVSSLKSLFFPFPRLIFRIALWVNERENSVSTWAFNWNRNGWMFGMLARGKWVWPAGRQPFNPIHFAFAFRNVFHSFLKWTGQWPARRYLTSFGGEVNNTGAYYHWEDELNGSGARWAAAGLGVVDLLDFRWSLCQFDLLAYTYTWDAEYYF